MNNKDNFRIVFMGTPDFAVESLKQIINNKYNVVAVVTSPDKPAGRGQKISESAVKQYAIEKGLNILQPTNLKDSDFQLELKKLNADLNVIVAFRMLPESVWNMPPLGSINLHASLLPQYRGAAPINWAVINGDKKTGATTFFLKHEIDTGNILYQTEFEIGENDTAGIVHDKLMVNGANLLVETLDRILSGDYKETPQDNLIEGELKHAPKIFKEDCKINWHKTGQEIHNLIRGLSPYPAAWCELISENQDPTTMKIFETIYIKDTHNEKPGTICTDGKRELKVCCPNGYIKINELQIAGKRRMKTEDFLRGFGQIDEYTAK